MEALGGNLAEGLSSEVWWSRASVQVVAVGETAADLPRVSPAGGPAAGVRLCAVEVVADALTRAQSNRQDEGEAGAGTDQARHHRRAIQFDAKHRRRTPLAGPVDKGTKYPWTCGVVFNDTAPHPQDCRAQAIG